MFASKSYRNCLEAEQLLMKDIRSEQVSARDRAMSANALVRVLEQKRIMKMKPAPKPVDAKQYEEEKKRRGAYGASFTEPTEIPAEEAPAKSMQPPNQAVDYEMQDMPGSSGAKVMVAKKPPAREREVAHVKSLKERIMDAKLVGEIS